MCADAHFLHSLFALASSAIKLITSNTECNNALSMENSFVEQITKRANKNFLIMSVLLEQQPMDVIRLLHVRLNKWTNVRCTMHAAHAQYIYYAHLWKFMANLWSKNVTLTIYHYMQWIQVAEHRLRAIFCLDIKVGEFELHKNLNQKGRQTDR